MIPKGFWEGETCAQCGEPLVERFVTMHRKVDDGYVRIEHVPADVCVSCGARYYKEAIYDDREF